MQGTVNRANSEERGPRAASLGWKRDDGGAIPHRIGIALVTAAAVAWSAVALCGIGIIAGNAQATSDIRGIVLACTMVLAIAVMTVAIRRYKQTSMVAAAAMSNFLGAIVSAPLAHGIASVTRGDIFVFAMFGFFQVAMGLTLFVVGSRLLPSGQASLIATLETPLMPFWVWLAFQEVPALHALVGGILVLGAVVADIIGDMRAQRKSAFLSDHVRLQRRAIALPSASSAAGASGRCPSCRVRAVPR